MTRSGRGRDLARHERTGLYRPFGRPDAAGLDTRHRLRRAWVETIAEGHNVYGLLMNRAGYDGQEPLVPSVGPFIVSRSGWAGTQR